MRFYLDCEKWEADYFITDAQSAFWRGQSGNIDQMLLDSAVSAGFCTGETPAAFRGRIPGCDRTMLWENGVIMDPYQQRNLEHSRWSEKYSWGFRTRFSVPAELVNARTLRLVFAALDYEADVYLNGRLIAHHRGAFIPLEIDVTGLVRCETTNLLALVFAPATQASPNQRLQAPADFSVYHRSQMSYGWDWMRAMVTVGISDRVWLESSGDIRISDLFFRSRAAKVTLEITAEVSTPGVYTYDVDLRPVNFAGPSVQVGGEQAFENPQHKFNIEFEVPDARYWYPCGYGDQPLYRLTVRLGDSRRETEVGLRDIEMLRNPESPADAYDQTFCINGQAIFARGLNWVPLELMPGRECEHDYERIVNLAADAGFNLFRIWGGGIVEREEFYRCCDRRGILVWQEFMHSCSSYPDDDEYLAFKRNEGESILLRLRNHVSLALICGGNEMQYYGQKPDSRLLLQYGELAARLTPDLAYHLSCPDRSRAGERDHGPWWVESHRVYNEHFRLVASEFGCMGMPATDSIAKFIPRSAWGDFPTGQQWKYHFLKLDDANGLYKQLEAFAASSLDDCVRASQFIQADSLQYFMQHYRTLWPKSSGCFVWQFNEPWPTFSLSLVDYYSQPKMAYYWLKRVNAGQLLAVIDDNLVIADGTYRGEVILVLDRAMNGIRVAVRCTDMAGRVLFADERSGDFPAGVQAWSRIELRGLDEGKSDMMMIELRIFDEFGQPLWRNEVLRGIRDFHSAFKLCECDVALKLIAGSDHRLEFELENKTAIPAVNIRLRAAERDEKNIYWQDNYFSIAAGEKRVAVLDFSGPAPERIEVEAWNLKRRSFEVHA